MEARKTTSSAFKYQKLPPELKKMIEDLIGENYLSDLSRFYSGEIKVLVDGRIFREEICLRIGFRKPGELRQFNLEASVDHTEKDNATDQIHRMVDCLGSIIEEMIEKQSSEEIPCQWSPVNFDGKTIFVQTSSANSDLEAQADELLREAYIEEIERITPNGEEILH